MDFYYTPEQVQPVIETQTCWVNVNGKPKAKSYPVVSVTISGDEWLVCHEYSFRRGCNKKTGTYGVGIENSKFGNNDPRIVERLGLLGEMALAKLWNLPVDFTERDYDQYDFMCHGKKIDIKVSNGYYSGNFIQVINQNGYHIPLRHDIYIGGHVAKEDKTKQFATIVLAGWQTHEFVEGLPTVKSTAKGASHYNKRLEYADLNPLIIPTDNGYEWVQF